MLSSLRRYGTVVALALIGAGLCVYYWSLHRRPFTQNAFLIANTRPVSPLVPGYLTELLVKNDQFVKGGTALFTTFKPPYELKVKELECAVAAEKAALAGLEAKRDSARALVVKAAAESANREYLAGQAARMYDGNAVSQTYTEEMRRARTAAAAQLESSRHELAVAEHAIRRAAATVKKLEHELALARIYLEQCTVYALKDGFISNMHISPGGYYKPGDVLFAFVENDVWWVQANFEETDLSLLRPGQKARIWLWQYPGKCFNGVVETVNWSVERRESVSRTGLQSVAGENQWFLMPQRFPVQIRIVDPDPEYPFHLGGSAFVQVDVSSQLFRQIVWRVFRW